MFIVSNFRLVGGEYMKQQREQREMKSDGKDTELPRGSLRPTVAFAIDQLKIILRRKK